MKCLVTGCAGFIGSHLCERLAQEGHDVVGVDCLTDYYNPKIKERNMEEVKSRKNFLFLKEDMANYGLERLVERADYVFHLAAQPGVRKSWEDFGLCMRNNILATQRLLEAAKDSEIKRLIFASSSSVYGSTKPPFREDMKLSPISPYGVSKEACESLCRLYWGEHNVPAVSLRLFTVYGPRQRPDMAFHRFISSILGDREMEIYGDGRQKRDFTYVSDVVEAFILAMGAEPGGAYNVGGGRTASVNDVIGMLERITGKEAKARKTEAQAGDMKETSADTARMERLGWKPKVALNEGLRRQVEWMVSG